MPGRKYPRRRKRYGRAQLARLCFPAARLLGPLWWSKRRRHRFVLLEAEQVYRMFRGYKERQ